MNVTEEAHFAAAERHVANGEFYHAVVKDSDAGVMEFKKAEEILDSLLGSYRDELELLVLKVRASMYLDGFTRR